MTTQILPNYETLPAQNISVLYGPFPVQCYTLEELEEIAEERRQICYQRYSKNVVANAPKVNHDISILSALYEIMYYIKNGLFEAFEVIKGSVTVNVTIKNETDFVVNINTPNQYFQFCDDKSLIFSTLKIKTFEKLVGPKMVKQLKYDLPVETPKTENNEVFEVGKSSCKKLTAIQIKTYSNPKDYLSTFSNASYPYWILKYASDDTVYFAPINAVDFKINLDYFIGFEFFAIESKKEKKSYITVYEKSTGFKVIEYWVCFLDSELTSLTKCDTEFSELIKIAINNLPFTIEPGESIESINSKRIAQNEIYVFGTTEVIAEPTNEVTSEITPEIAKIVKEEFGVIGSVKVNYNVSTCTFEINGIENGKKTKFSLWNCDGIPKIEYVFDVWMEEFEVIEPKNLTVGQKIQGENCHLVVTAIKEPKEPETQEIQETVQEPINEPITPTKPKMNFYPTTEKVTVENYPYGYTAKTTAFYSIEFKKGFGFRQVFQTINPKTGRLNNPKNGTYYTVLVLCKDEENGHIESTALSFYGLEQINNGCKFLAANFDLFTPEQMKYIYKELYSFLKVNFQAQVSYYGMDVKELAPYYKEVMQAAAKGFNTGENIFSEIVLDIPAIEALKVPNFQPFKITSYERIA